MHKKINPLLQTKPLASYPADLMHSIKMVSFDPNKNAEPFGSYIYRLQKYPGDIDLFEEYIDEARPNQLVHKFAERLKEMIRKIQRAPLHWFSEFKAGIDPRYDIDIGDLLKGKWFNIPNIPEISINLMKDGLLDQDEVNNINNTLNNIKLSEADKYDIIFNIFRNHRILRWTENEILHGVKEVTNRIFKLHDCLFDQTYIKIDVIVYSDSKFTELTNFIGLVSERDNIKDYININLKKNNDPKVSLPLEIEKLYFSNYYYSPFKSCKRMYSYGRQLDIKNILKKVIPIVTGDISLLYMLKSQLDVIKLLLERIYIKMVPMNLVINSIDGMKNELSYVLFLSDRGLKESYDLMNKIIYGYIPESEIITILQQLIDKWMISINYETIKQMKKYKINPPPLNALPNPMHYEYFTRDN